MPNILRLVERESLQNHSVNWLLTQVDQRLPQLLQEHKVGP
jgi:hypothetical protein